jgi:hypothetical protein
VLATGAACCYSLTHGSHPCLQQQQQQQHSHDAGMQMCCMPPSFADRLNSPLAAWLLHHTGSTMQAPCSLRGKGPAVPGPSVWPCGRSLHRQIAACRPAPAPGSVGYIPRRQRVGIAGLVSHRRTMTYASGYSGWDAANTKLHTPQLRRQTAIHATFPHSFGVPFCGFH